MVVFCRGASGPSQGYYHAVTVCSAMREMVGLDLGVHLSDTDRTMVITCMIGLGPSRSATRSFFSTFRGTGNDL